MLLGKASNRRQPKGNDCSFGPDRLGETGPAQTGALGRSSPGESSGLVGSLRFLPFSKASIKTRTLTIENHSE